MNLPCHFKEELKLYDYGDIVSEDNKLIDLQHSLSELVCKALKDDTFPIVLGGGHEVAYGSFKGIKSHVAKESVGIINFDAHFDLRPQDDGGSSGTMFSQIATDAKNKNEEFAYFCIGIQQRGNTRALFNLAKSLGADYILARDVSQENMLNIFKSLDKFIKHKDHIYITICMDVFSSAFAPGVSSAQPLGLQPWLVLTILKYILKSNKVICMDIAEVSPRFDLDNVTANLASTIVFHAVQQLAENKDLDYDDIT
jgi:formiminoglutamase